jgi:DNA-binding NarL/FixJ family response regulator
VLLVDDQALIRAGFRALLNAEDDVDVVAEGADGGQAVTHAAHYLPDVA